MSSLFGLFSHVKFVQYDSRDGTKMHSREFTCSGTPETPLPQEKGPVTGGPGGTEESIETVHVAVTFNRPYARLSQVTLTVVVGLT